MRSITTLLAALLSLLMVSTSASASVCDLTCWFHQAHSDCHRPGLAQASKGDTDMSMPGMDMGASNAENSMGPETVKRAMPAHSVAMSPQQEMIAERLEHGTKTQLGTSSMHDHSNRTSTCAHEVCSQVSASASPPNADHSQPSSLLWIPTYISNPVNLWTAFHWISPGSPPARILAVDCLTTSLRI